MNARSVTPRVGVRFPDAVTAAVDAAARAQDDELNRSEMIRRIVTAWLRENGFLEGR
ncbi:ribbon-helix-helix protein, CopG family [Salinarimonas chemoclinalis]|uniref:ribbon-helix-helix protein, CopG family n=1 Tax=Salinarimonas chemoclinalis TaxID=3241599 RepID=UPI003557CE31